MVRNSSGHRNRRGPLARLRRVRVIVVVLALLVASSLTPLAQGPGGVNPGAASAAETGAANEAEARARDAQAYAAHYGVDLQEAIRRLQLQRPIGELGAALETGERGTYAGLWIQHKPDFRVIARFTRDGEQTIRPYIADGPLVGLVEVRPARLTLAHLEAAQDVALRRTRPLGVPVNAGLNLFENRAEIYVVERARLEAALQGANIQLPDGVVVTTVPELAREAADVYAGLWNSDCTMGYAVRDSSGTVGISTAGHCDNDQWYAGTHLPFQGDWFFGAYDVQWNTAPGHTIRSWAYDGICCPEYRYINGTKGRVDQQVGEWVCHYGRTTGYGCGFIEDKYFLGATPGGTETYIHVHRDGVVLSRGGDSGGPWFNGSTAYGIMHASFGDDAIYMAINYYGYLGLTVLTNCPSEGC